MSNERIVYLDPHDSRLQNAPALVDPAADERREELLYRVARYAVQCSDLDRAIIHQLLMDSKPNWRRWAKSFGVHYVTVSKRLRRIKAAMMED